MAQISVLFPQQPTPEETGAEAALREAKRIVEALLFAAAEPLEETELRKRLADSVNIRQVLEALKADYSTRGINLVRVGSKWIFRTAADEPLLPGRLNADILALWRKDEARSAALHARDRSAIYGAFHLYHLKGAI